MDCLDEEEVNNMLVHRRGQSSRQEGTELIRVKVVKKFWTWNPILAVESGGLITLYYSHGVVTRRGYFLFQCLTSLSQLPVTPRTT